MNETFSAYGKVLIAVIIVAAFLALLLFAPINGHKGVLNYLGVAVNAEEQNYDDYDDAISSKDIGDRDKPIIKYTQKEEVLETNTAYDLRNEFTATDADGNELDFDSISITSIVFEDGQILYQQDEDTKLKTNNQSYKNYTFAKSGQYEVTVYVKDSYGLVATKTFSIPVNRKRGT